MPLLRSAATVTALLVAIPVLTGCGQGSSDRSLSDLVEDAVAEARERVEEASGDVRVGEGPSRNVPIRNDTRTRFDYDTYTALVRQVLSSLERYWETAMPGELGTPYRGDPAGYYYYRPEERPGPRCGRQAAPPRNAFYCPSEDFIAWDESGLLIPYYLQGDFAAAYVLAHEFGHAMQVRLPASRQLEVGILRELQADCFAGAWARHVAQAEQLAAGDLDEAVAGIYSGRDVPGTPFTDPRAHGSGFERIRAFGDGYEAGPRQCRQADWVVGSTP